MTFTIGLDLDGVCYQWDRTARYMIRQRILDRGETPDPGLSWPSESWDWIQDHSPKADWRWLWSGGIEAGLFRYGHVVRGAMEGVRELAKLGSVVAITARPQSAVHDTLAWLSLFFDKVPLSGIVIQSDGQKKSQVTPAPDVYIDDGIHNYLDILGNTEAYIVQFVQPWNRLWSPRESDRGRWLRADGWPETVEKVRWAKEHRDVLVNSR
jgi:5'(3')-deoxyribonucleotidase